MVRNITLIWIVIYFNLFILLYIPKIGDRLKILTLNEVKDFVVINFGEYFKSTREKLYSKLNEEQSLDETLYIFLTTSDNVEKYVEMMQ